MKKKYTVVIIIACLILCSVVALSLLKHKNQGPGGELYYYSGIDASCNYSENSVLYLDGSGIMHMIDTALGKDVIYCDKPNCTHEEYSSDNVNPSCPAVFWGLIKAGPVPYNGQMYFIGNMSGEDEFTTQYLYEMDSNCENRRIAAALEGIQDVRYVLCRDNYICGGYVNRVEINEDGQIINDNKPESGIFVIDLDSYEVHKADVITGEQANVTGIFYENGAVYYSVMRFRDDITEIMIEEAAGQGDGQNFTYEYMLYEIYRYDIASGENQLLITLDHINNLQLLDGNAYYSAADGIYVFDTETGETTKLDIDPAALDYGPAAKNGDDLYFCVWDDESGDVIYYRMENDETTELTRLLAGDAFGITNICGESVYISYYDATGQYCEGVLGLEDFNNGEFSPRMLRYYNEEN